MTETKLQIKNKRGLHARASAKFVSCARGFQADIMVRHNGMSVPATSLMGLMMLGASCGARICLTAEGAEAEAALAALTQLVDEGFGEGAD